MQPPLHKPHHPVTNIYIAKEGMACVITARVQEVSETASGVSYSLHYCMCEFLENRKFRGVKTQMASTHIWQPPSSVLIAEHESCSGHIQILHSDWPALSSWSCWKLNGNCSYQERLLFYFHTSHYVKSQILAKRETILLCCKWHFMHVMLPCLCTIVLNRLFIVCLNALDVAIAHFEDAWYCKIHSSWALNVASLFPSAERFSSHCAAEPPVIHCLACLWR